MKAWSQELENCNKTNNFKCILNYRFFIRLKNVHQNGIYDFQFNREITQLRSIEKLLNIPEEEDDEITPTN
jgi:hypothetical protein